MLIMPYSHDQPDNARRMRRLKVAESIEKGSYTPERVARKLASMLGDPSYADEGRLVAAQLAKEHGVGTACDALLELYARKKNVG
jgi:UDP:flavonoid glycosyltransferase YjiC (YdhE family)